MPGNTGGVTDATLQRRVQVQVQGRDGRAHEFVIHTDGPPYNNTTKLLLSHTVSTAGALRLIIPATTAAITPTPPPPTTTITTKTTQTTTKTKTTTTPSQSPSPAASFFWCHHDVSNLVLIWLEPDSWLELEGVGRAGRRAVADSGFWLSRRLMAGHSLRFRPEGRKKAYLRHRRAVWRVARSFEDLRRFARFPANVFNPGATLAEIYSAEKRTGVVFPDEVRASFSLFDGQARSVLLRSEGVIGGFELLCLSQSVELMLQVGCFRGDSGQLEFVPLANRRNINSWLVAAVKDGRICLVKPLSRLKVVAPSWSAYLRVQ